MPAPPSTCTPGPAPRAAVGVLDALVADLAPHHPRVVVAFGGSPLVLRLARAFPAATVFCVEHRPGAYRRASEILAATAIVNADVLLRPLAWQWHGGLLCRSYRRGTLPPVIDAVVVAGPPPGVPGGREACLHQAASSLRPGSRVYLPGLHRPAARRTWRAWQRHYRGQFTRCRLPGGPSAGVLVALRRVHLCAGWPERVRHHAGLVRALAARADRRARSAMMDRVRGLPRIVAAWRGLRDAGPRGGPEA